MVNFSVSSAVRGLAVLELLVENKRGLQISEIAHRLALPLGATHRLLHALMERDYVKQDTYGERYLPTIRLGALGLRLIAGIDLAEVAQPILDDLARQSGELVRLAVVEADTMTWVAKAQGATGVIRCDSILGKNVPLHTTAMGKDWLAHMPEEDAVGLVVEKGFDAELRGPNAILTAPQLRKELRLSRMQGFSLNDQESELGLVAIGMVIRDVDGSKNVVGALSIAGPVFRVDHERLVGFAPMLRQAVQALEQIQASGVRSRFSAA